MNTVNPKGGKTIIAVKKKDAKPTSTPTPTPTQPSTTPTSTTSKTTTAPDAPIIKIASGGNFNVVSDDSKFKIKTKVEYIIKNLILNGEDTPLEISKITDDGLPIFIQSVTTDNADSITNYQSLEILGDKIMNATFTAYVKSIYPLINDDNMTKVSNYFLSKGADSTEHKQASKCEQLELNKIIIHAPNEKIDRGILEDVIESFYGALWKASELVSNGLGFYMCLKLTEYIYRDDLKTLDYDTIDTEYSSAKTWFKELYSVFDIDDTQFRKNQLFSYDMKTNESKIFLWDDYDKSTFNKKHTYTSMADFLLKMNKKNYSNKSSFPLATVLIDGVNTPGKIGASIIGRVDTNDLGLQEEKLYKQLKIKMALPLGDGGFGITTEKIYLTREEKKISNVYGETEKKEIIDTLNDIRSKINSLKDIKYEVISLYFVGPNDSKNFNTNIIYIGEIVKDKNDNLNKYRKILNRMAEYDSKLDLSTDPEVDKKEDYTIKKIAKSNVNFKLLIDGYIEDNKKSLA